MRVAVICDIHGNLPALQAVLADVERVLPDLIVVGGDIASGPMPRQTLDLLLARDRQVRYIRGNADRELVAYVDGSVREKGLRDLDACRDAWAARQITRQQRDFLAGLPASIVLDIDGLGPVLFCHGSPRSDEEIITAATPEARMRDMLAGVEPRVIVCGHTHMQFERRIGEARVLNAGSVGMPYEGRPGAYWLLLGPDVSFRRTEYDLQDAASEILASGFPDAGAFVRENLLNPPSTAEATEFFETLSATPED